MTNAISYIAAAIVALLPLSGDVSSDLLTHLTSALPVIKTAEPSITTAYKPTPIPVKVSSQPLELSAASALAIDLDSNETLYSANASAQRPIASITKIVTALVILQKHAEDEQVTIPPLPSYTGDDEVVGLKVGDSYTIKDLLVALLVNSANDAADSLAIIDSGSREAFAQNMNQFVDQWGISGAKFSNPSGLSDINNGASAEALAKIAALALRNPTIAKLVSVQQTSITSLQGNATNIKSTNTLLQNGQFSGIKTGYTLAAGQCFVGLTTVQGHKIITVILGSKDRFGESTRLADWINSTFQWQSPPS